MIAYHDSISQYHGMFTAGRLLVLIVATHGGMARLSWPVQLVTYQDDADLNQSHKRHSSQ